MDRSGSGRASRSVGSRLLRVGAQRGPVLGHRAAGRAPEALRPEVPQLVDAQHVRETQAATGGVGPCIEQVRLAVRDRHGTFEVVGPASRSGAPAAGHDAPFAPEREARLARREARFDSRAIGVLAMREVVVDVACPQDRELDRRGGCDIGNRLVEEALEQQHAPEAQLARELVRERAGTSWRSEPTARCSALPDG